MASDLYKKLYNYRQSIRDKENKHTASAVIADEPLKALARSKPTSIEDMLKIGGIGKAFVTKYGNGFLNIILNEQKPVKLTMMSSETSGTLKNLQSRLTNVNRRNRMLYLPKAVPSRAIDVCGGGIKLASAVADALLSSGGGIKLCDADGDEAMYGQYCKLIRYTASVLRETGANTLYAGYPFVTGKCGAGKNSFNVCAPLVLFPVRLENVGGKIELHSDDTRDITYNNALILCFNKFNSRSGALPRCAIDDIKKRDFMSDISEFYAQSGMDVRYDGGSFEKLGQYTEKNFPKYAANEYAVKNNIVIGSFPMHSGAMQKDFDDLIESGLMPPTLTGLLDAADEVTDIYGVSTDLLNGDIPIDSEGYIDYIHELNVSQETAIEKSTEERFLVMQGPPGTGKSQTITSMITDAVDDGKNVLVVSQKRAALSVIYSRLGKLSRYALFVDDPKDKESFYGRLKAMFDAASAPAPFNDVAYNRAIKTVDADIDALDSVADSLNSQEYGASMLTIYRENMENPFKLAERDISVSGTSESALYRDNVPQSLLDCGYDDLKASSAYLADDSLLEDLNGYYELASGYPWLVDMRKGMSAGKIGQLSAELDGILDEYAYGKSKFKFKRKIKAFVKANFIKYNRKLYKAFVKNSVELYNGVKAYTDFYDCKTTADTLDYCTRLYFGVMYGIKCETGKPLSEINGRLLEYCGYAFIQKYEYDHRDAISKMSSYQAIVSRICSSIDKKCELVRDKTMQVLKTAFNTNMAESKRRGDMLRAIDGKRRRSAAEFVEKFEFELFRGVRIFLMTPEAVSEILPLRNDLFDLLVFDEASQIYVERGIPAIVRAARLVVCGDHKQLRPSSLGDGRVAVDEDEESEAVLEEESLLDVARFKFPEVMLSYHYRSRYEELIAFSNAAFYGGKLNISPNPSAPSEPPIAVHKVNGLWEDRVNKAEAEKTLQLIAEHLERGAAVAQRDRETLGVITFNAQQRDCILDMIDKRCDADERFRELYTAEYMRKEDGEDRGLFVKNIENVQGDERDRIIFSFAYAYNNKGVMSRNFGWLNRPGGENRLNVAISRAKRKIDIVTSIIPSDLRVDDIKTAGVHILRKYLDYAYCVSSGDKAGAKHILDLVSAGYTEEAVDVKYDVGSLKFRIAEELSRRGYAVETDVGMGNYKLDVAVKDQRGDYVLGIECDDSVYTTDASTRERDVMRKKFLTSRGWKLCRVWTVDWYDNSERVIKDIAGKIAAKQ